MLIFHAFYFSQLDLSIMGMRVDARKPYALVYSFCKHEFLGFLIEPHVVQLNQDGSLSLTHQRIFTATASEYNSVLSDQDWKLIGLFDKIEQAQVIKRFHKKNVRPSVYFSEVFNEEKAQKIRPWIENVLTKALSLLKEKPLYLMSKEGYPASEKLTLAEEPCSVLFHFRRNEEEVRYFPTLKYQGKRIEFMFKDAQVVVNHPAVLLLENTLHHFVQDIDGKKLSPFLNKRYIAIPRAAEENYFKLFVAPLIERFNVYAVGFEIKTLQFEAVPLVRLLGNSASGFSLLVGFRYGEYSFDGLAENPVSVVVEYEEENDRYVFYRIKRSLKWEEKMISRLQDLGNFPAPESGFSALDWLNEHQERLKELGFEVVQEVEGTQYQFGKMALNLEVNEDNDWFDIQALVHFGSYSIPFIQLRDHILNHNREFILPSGEVALIPEHWFSQFGVLFQFSGKHNSIGLKRQYLGILEEIQESEIAGVSMQRKLEKLQSFTGVEEYSVPTHFKASLRPYQKAGYDWFHFLKKYRFGGCLADDMGLGKTVQTLALLQKEQEGFLEEGRRTSFIVMPTSLIYNWIEEAKRFAPKLKILNHTGVFRAKDASEFYKYDLVLCTYGTVRMDKEFLKDFLFHYIVLDESQHIKNPHSKSFKAVISLKGKHRLILTGTPIENSVADLWPQMEFLNPGLLGGQTSFMNNFVIPIEKKKDQDQLMRLQALVKPFILRRTKAQVANELPEKSEQILYSTMTKQQSEYYEKVKAEFRNEILEQSLVKEVKSGVQVLQGISQLRQLANHPKMIDLSYKGDSGKFNDVIEQLSSVLARGHKVLLFSSFVKQMQLYKEYFDAHRISYAYLDGSTADRGGQVESFRQDPSIQVFLISIKAGGVGLNLIEADYVFILDPWWNPAVEMQAVDRAHRIGQTKKVFIYKFISKDTVEEKILALQKKKKVYSEELIQVEESFVKSLSPEDIALLLT